MKASKDIDSYIASYPQKTQVFLKKMQAVICKAAPQATEAISYGVPTYKLNGNLVHFGGFKSHIGFFPTPSGIKHFQKELSAYKTSKGAVQFPIEKPIAVGLVAKIVEFRVKESAEAQIAPQRSGSGGGGYWINHGGGTLDQDYY